MADVTLGQYIAMLDEIETKLDTLIAKDYATQTTLAALLAKIIAAPATEDKQDAIKSVLDTLAGKDYATQATLAAVLAKLSADPSTATKQDALKAVVDTISTAVAERATEATLAAIKTLLENGTAKMTLNGSFATLRPMLGATKTASGVASEVFAGAGRLAGRRGISIKNEHPYLRLRIDGAAVTDTTGIALEPFAQAVFEFDPAIDVPVYVISEAGLVKYGVVEW